jgi:hypothetical protein
MTTTSYFEQQEQHPGALFTEFIEPEDAPAAQTHSR